MAKNRIFNQMKKAKQSGLTNVDLAKVRAAARKEAMKVENEIYEKTFLYMLAIPLNVLVNDYWPKSAKKKAPKLIGDVISLYESVRDGIVTDQELVDLLEEYAGVTVNEVWLEKVGIWKKTTFGSCINPLKTI